MISDKIYYKDFRVFLKKEFEKRKDNNTNYSLRAFARDLKISASTLSDLINNKKEPSKQTISKLGEILLLNKEEISPYLTLAREVDNELDLYEDLIPDGNEKLPTSDRDRRKVLSNVYHYAVMQLFHFPSFRPENSWIAEQLGLSSEKICDIIERLQRLNIINISKDGKWTSHAPDFASYSAKKGDDSDIEINLDLQRQALDHALYALENLTYDNIDQSTIMFPMKRNELPIIKKRIEQFRRELAAEFTRDEKEFDSIYQFSFSTFPLTKM